MLFVGSVRKAVEVVYPRCDPRDHDPVLGPVGLQERTTQVSSAASHGSVHGFVSGLTQVPAFEHDAMGRTAHGLENQDVAGTGGHLGRNKAVDILLPVGLESG